MSSSAPASSPADLNDLYRDNHAWLVSLLRRRLPDAAQAQDLAHDTFERIMRADLAQVLKAPRAYLTTVARNVLLNHVRHERIARAYQESLENLPEPLAPSPEEQLLAVQALEQACAVLDGLPARTRLIFLMSQLEGMTSPEIAAELKLSVNVVKKAVAQGIKHCYFAMVG
ncbi:sigma-70 family RNA polymerase sigma factor [Kerstersia gyiorum]|nr:sigma-70 family RNA polymerase sigma factor [Kerstersia gyiorum]MCP1633565.1 RNA polymerase sigma-70 factor (ECF subfamily) [Kerstersia gyiorum]MCP1637179.1 RNA polymerase sigma-70 factor (ECF subfamily) [Kerstersia gyiorum]MCP1672144.1 RNA polymerase sigma-70 factor (ECF subfamily) [Kerstersia gyiorum]MCP1679637.1 RNA polymerase sigma-70 factor (ECF subfamily) [Kerstersia gyiorum]MCP1682799.1 RNA polymerase sigma-70 factor (ECF subfamily) [Kerstersia gyiorum]